MRRKAFTLAAAFVLVFAGAASAARFHLPGGESTSIDEAAARAVPGPDENIKSVIIYKGDGVSVHAIGIRGAEKPHVHMEHDLIVTLKSGKGSLTVGVSSREMAEGDWTFIPRGAPHYFVNTGAAPAVGIGIFMPEYDGRDSVPAGSDGGGAEGAAR